MQSIRYIAFLRAINVGERVVTMERLRALFTALGFTGVRTYIQSGNVFFDSPEHDREMLTHTFERHLLESLGYKVSVLLRTIPEVEHALELDPFKDVVVDPDMRLYVIFISRPLPDSVELPLTSPKGDYELVAATAGEVFVVLRLIDGRPGNPGAFIEKTFGVKATARFYGTTAKILQAAKAESA